MANHKDIAARWAQRATGRTDKSALGNRQNVFERDGKIYSYGSHFEMGRYVKPKGGAPFFLLNGDRYSVTTSRHQAYVRDAVQETGMPSVLIPHTALQRAGVILDTIVPVDVQPETSETIPHTVTVPGLVDLGKRAASGSFGWDDSNARRVIGGRNVLTGNDGAPGALSAERTLKYDGATYLVRALKRGYDYSATRQDDCGACEGTGKLTFTDADTGDAKTYACTNPACQDGKTTGWGAWADYDPPRVTYYRNGAGLSHVDGDTFTYETFRHWLGGCVFYADVESIVYRTCQDHKPGADDYGTGTRSWCDHCGEYVNEHNQGTAHRYRETVKRRAWFISGWDENEPGGLYFLAELPAKSWQLAPNATGWDWVFAPNRPKTYSDAVTSLMPRDVKLVPPSLVKRQGDIFAVPCGEHDGPPPIAARYAERGVAVPLDGTHRHIVTELVTCADGGNERVYARGTMRHSGRDHRALKLGNTWHRLYRNTVPMRKVSGNVPGADVGTPLAWTIQGRVD